MLLRGFLAATITAAFFAPAATPLPPALPLATCTPVAYTPNVTAIMNYGLPMGRTDSCGGNNAAAGYHFTIKMSDANTGQVLSSYSGVAYGTKNYIEGFWAMCLRPDGTGRNVQTTLYLNVAGFSRSDTSPSVKCQRIGGQSE